MKAIDRDRAASEASLLLNESIRQLLIPQHLFAFFNKLNESGRVPMRYASAVRHVAITSAVVNLYRVKEAHEHLLIYLFPRLSCGRWGFLDLTGSSATGSRSRWSGTSTWGTQSGEKPLGVGPDA